MGKPPKTMGGMDNGAERAGPTDRVRHGSSLGMGAPKSAAAENNGGQPEPAPCTPIHPQLLLQTRAIPQGKATGAGSAYWTGWKPCLSASFGSCG